MNSFKFFETIVNVVPVAISTLSHGQYLFNLKVSGITSLGGAESRRFQRLTQRYGAVATFFTVLRPEAWEALDGIERVLQGHDSDANEFKQSVSGTLNMVAAASALIAQVAITALSLDGIESVHWTAAAFFVASLMSGLLAVYSAFLVLNTLNNLIGAQQLRRWLSLPPKTSSNDADPDPDGCDDSGELPMSKDPSLSAAMAISSPTGLLSLSLLCLIIGIGDYFVCVYINNLRPGWDIGGSRGILIFYSLATALGLQQYSFPAFTKSVETAVFQVIYNSAVSKGKRTVRDRPNENPEPAEANHRREVVLGAGTVDADIETGLNGGHTMTSGLKQHQDSAGADSSIPEFEEMFQAYLQTQEESHRLGRALLEAYSRRGIPRNQ